MDYQEETITRQPRMLGLTFLSLQHQQHKTEESKQKLYQHLISQYTINGFTLQGRSMNIYELSQYLNIKPEQTMQYINQVSASIGSLVNPAQIQETMQSIISLSSTWAMQDRGQIELQNTLLLKSQGNKYKPFISSEVNKSLKLKLEANKNLMEAYKTFFTSSNNQTNILNIYGEQNKDSQDTLSPSSALELILDTTKDDDKTLPQHFTQENEALFKLHKLGETPDCLERRTGTDALRTLEPVSQLVTKPSGPMAGIPNQSKDVWNHSDPLRKRGEDEDTTDQLP